MRAAVDPAWLPDTAGRGLLPPIILHRPDDRAPQQAGTQSVQRLAGAPANPKAGDSAVTGAAEQRRNASWQHALSRHAPQMHGFPLLSAPCFKLSTQRPAVWTTLSLPAPMWPTSVPCTADLAQLT